MMMAFFVPTDICLAPVICSSLSCGLRSVDCSKSVIACSIVFDSFEQKC